MNPASGHQKSSAGILPQSLYVRYSIIQPVYVITQSESAREVVRDFTRRFREQRQASASSGGPGSLRFSYTIIIHIGALDFRSKVSGRVQERPVASGSSSFTPGGPGSLRFLYAIIIHIDALDFRRKVSTPKM